MKSISFQTRSLQLAPASWRLGVLPAALAVLLGARAADADCGPPQPSVDFTYPDETTESVPPDAVFWIVSPAGGAQAWIDDVPLSSRGASGVEQHQFVYPVPLAEGEHELVARAGNSEARTVTFRVAARAPSTGDASIDAVDVYPLVVGPDGVEYPPEYDAECAQLVTRLQDVCNDTGFSELARIKYSGEGDIVAYLVEGRIVPPQCPTLVKYGGSNDASTYSIRAITPTGVTEERTFDGTVETHSASEAYPDVYSHPEACSIGFGQRAPGALASVGLALAAWLIRRRQRET